MDLILIFVLISLLVGLFLLEKAEVRYMQKDCSYLHTHMLPLCKNNNCPHYNECELSFYKKNYG